MIHHFGLLTTELGRRNAEIERFVTGSRGGARQLRQRAAGDPGIAGRVPGDPGGGAGRAGRAPTPSRVAARPALIGLIPQAQALGPALQATERFFDQTTAPIRDQIRPFTRQVRPVLTHTKQGAADLEKTVTGFGNSLGGLNALFNELAFKPKGEAELPLLPALGQPRPQRHLQHRRRRRPGPARPGR